MRRLLHYTWSVCILFLVLIQHPCQAQEKIGMPLYFDLSKNDLSVVHEIRQPLLSVQYYDPYGRSKDITLKVYNWTREVVAEFVLGKSRGLNHYNIKLDAITGGLEKDRTYTCEATDEMGRKSALSFRFTEAEEKDIVAGIFVNPKFLKCDDKSGNLVEFYGEVSGGKAPYTVLWYVLNDHRTDFLYQPREQHIQRQGSTATIQVSKAPDYYVILHVKDACGNEQHQVVHLICEKGKKKVNTLFFESITDITKQKITQ